MTREEKIDYLAKAVMTLSELGDGKAAYALNEIRLEMKSQLELLEGLEEAEDKYAHSLGYDEEKDRVEIAAAKDDFIAGAEWQKDKMMEMAVGGRYMKAVGKVYVESWPLDIDPDSVKAGDEVRLIVIPEEK